MENAALQVRDVIIGKGMPKICVPVTGSTEAEIISQAEAFAVHGADLAEWRVDLFEGRPEDTDRICMILQKLRSALKNTPLLVTCRTREEGGQAEVTQEIYEKLNLAVIATGLADLIDIEYFKGEQTCLALMEKAHKKGMYVVMSSHDFEKTPPKEEIIKRMKGMRSLGADIPKTAVMPHCRKDVLTLLSATAELTEELTCPVITMSMGQLGAVSRIAGGTFGSAVTFASAGQSSAPGQMNVEQVRTALKMLQMESERIAEQE